MEHNVQLISIRSSGHIYRMEHNVQLISIRSSGHICRMEHNVQLISIRSSGHICRMEHNVQLISIFISELQEGRDQLEDVNQNNAVSRKLVLFDYHIHKDSKAYA